MQPQLDLQYPYAKSLNFLSAVAEILGVVENFVDMQGGLAVQGGIVDMVEMGDVSYATYQRIVISLHS